VIEAMLARLPRALEAAAGAAVQPIKFEKDDDRNFHVDFATAATNLRATIYGIEPTDRLRVKSVAGRIIPAMVRSGEGEREEEGARI
jgi:ubiquitin-activating enzyme E1